MRRRVRAASAGGRRARLVPYDIWPGRECDGNTVDLATNRPQPDGGIVELRSGAKSHDRFFWVCVYGADVRSCRT